ncbi:peroxiredoxin [Kamptonema cortianum]|nr:peroxiredoxin [Oscillatoria laete-virens]MDK3158025.1 peroxiredoxin [Kamptonema cortianum]MDL5048206.1 peroxiredoxin [Oscillatoria amoena NRMC-F 0135]MDL5053099.1 peroxiredoxin [Oscillatoria laete-virens NRMC-F 0139]
MLKIGDKLPTFSGQAYLPDGNFKEIHSSDFHGRWLVVFFWPLDFTFVCPTEIKGFNNLFEDFKKLNAEILGVSTDSEFSHKAWVETDPKKGGLGPVKFPLYADTNRRVTESFGCLFADKGIAYRGTFIFDAESVLQSYTVNTLHAGRSVKETLRTLQALQAGGLAPCEWEPGKDLIKV